MCQTNTWAQNTKTTPTEHTRKQTRSKRTHKTNNRCIQTTIMNQNRQNRRHALPTKDSPKCVWFTSLFTRNNRARSLQFSLHVCLCTYVRAPCVCACVWVCGCVCAREVCKWVHVLCVCVRVRARFGQLFSFTFIAVAYFKAALNFAGEQTAPDQTNTYACMNFVGCL